MELSSNRNHKPNAAAVAPLPVMYYNVEAPNDVVPPPPIMNAATAARNNLLLITLLVFVAIMSINLTVVIVQLRNVKHYPMLQLNSLFGTYAEVEDRPDTHIFRIFGNWTAQITAQLTHSSAVSRMRIELNTAFVYYNGNILVAQCEIPTFDIRKKQATNLTFTMAASNLDSNIVMGTSGEFINGSMSVEIESWSVKWRWNWKRFKEKANVYCDGVKLDVKKKSNESHGEYMAMGHPIQCKLKLQWR